MAVVRTDGNGNASAGDRLLACNYVEMDTLLPSFLDACLGAGEYEVSGTYTPEGNVVIDFRTVSESVLTGALGTPSAGVIQDQARMGAFIHSHTWTNSAEPFQLNSSDTTSKVEVQAETTGFLFSTVTDQVIRQPDGKGYFCGNNKGFGQFWMIAENNYIFQWAGELSDPLAPYVFPLNCAYLMLVNNGGNKYHRSGRIAGVNSTARQALLGSGDANYTPTLVSGSYSLPDRTTDLYLLDDNSGLGNPAIGKFDNLLLATSGTWNIGEFYDIDNVDGSDSIQGSTADTYICVAEYGTQHVLMRSIQ